MQRRRISPMLTLHTTAELRAALAGQSPVLVPTMGNLHAGHMRLIERAVAEKTAGRASVVVASLFVNRLQFLPHEDFDTYPRTLDADCQQLEAAGCDLVFAPKEAEMYPQPQTFKVQPDPALGWHLWATDLCLQAETIAGVPVAKIIEIPLFHNSVTAHQLPQEFHHSAERLLAKYPQRSSIPTLCGSITRSALPEAAVS